MGKPEGVVEDYLCSQAKHYNYICWKFISPSQDGVPDRILIGKDRVIFIETKSGSGRLRKLQSSIIANMKKHGADVRVVNSKELVDKLFSELEKPP